MRMPRWLTGCGHVPGRALLAVAALVSVLAAAVLTCLTSPAAAEPDAGPIPAGTKIHLILRDSTEFDARLESFDASVARLRLRQAGSPSAGDSSAEDADPEFRNIVRIRHQARQSLNGVGLMGGVAIGAGLVAVGYGHQDMPIGAALMGALAGGIAGFTLTEHRSSGGSRRIPTDPLEAVTQLKPGRDVRVELRDGTTLSGAYRSVDFDRVSLKVLQESGESVTVREIPFREVERIRYRPARMNPAGTMTITSGVCAGLGALMGLLAVRGHVVHGAHGSAWWEPPDQASATLAGAWIGGIFGLAMGACAALATPSTVTIHGP
jgi:hypothetical protein